ncbi:MULTISPECIES: prolyl-tRNA synthetase associated domain-containing protein [Clostridium]|uniref:Prolyl-tRNA editing protein ProX n=1 Tax=Clostridium ragsdalei P11 TaxID=1353534 RepID=A0A1A6AI16_9CLOT|nr:MULTISPECIES: prolyl-tRNA synthetase associated domain-containing protein [Clostridium]OBR89663.1 prolyl-tRNA editing protein ProX [Clostridium ragsdalei P11]QXE21070.1 prolyl-tRNA editing protein [Clostridium sp. 001]
MTKIHIDSTIYTTKPADSRLSKEMAVYDLLEELDIPYSRIDHDVTASIEDCHNVERLLRITICKNLFLCNSQKTDFYLLMMPGDKKFKTKELSAQIQSSRLSFAPAEYMEKYLNITPGSVSVMGLMNDADHNVKLLIDEDVIKEEYVGCHPCINTSSLKIKTKYIIDKFLPHTEHLPTYVKLTGK